MFFYEYFCILELKIFEEINDILILSFCIIGYGLGENKEIIRINIDCYKKTWDIK